MSRRPFVLSIPSVSRFDPDGEPSSEYQVALPRDYLGDYMVEVTVSMPYVATNLNASLSLCMRGQGINSECTKTEWGEKPILTCIPGGAFGRGTFYTNGKFGGVIDVLWRNDSETDPASFSDVDFPEHTIYLHFTPV